MASNGNWIKLYRSMLDWEWYKCDNTKILFLHLLLIVNIKPQRKQGIVIPAGSIDRTQKQLMQELGFTRQQLRTALSNLELTNEITKVDMGKFSVISIAKWNEFQAKQPTNNQGFNQRTTNEQPKNNHLNKNIKNIEERKEEKDEFTPDGVTWIDGVPYYSDEFLEELHKND